MSEHEQNDQGSCSSCGSPSHTGSHTPGCPANKQADEKLNFEEAREEANKVREFAKSNSLSRESRERYEKKYDALKIKEATKGLDHSYEYDEARNEAMREAKKIEPKNIDYNEADKIVEEDKERIKEEKNKLKNLRNKARLIEEGLQQRRENGYEKDEYDVEEELNDTLGKIESIERYLNNFHPGELNKIKKEEEEKDALEIAREKIKNIKS